MEITLWNVYTWLVAATVILLSFLSSYYLLSVKRKIKSTLAPGIKKIAQGFLLLLALSGITVVGSLLGALPTERLNSVGMMLLPSLVWALLLLYLGSRQLAKALEQAPKSVKA